jgi:copper transport protein
VLVLIIGVWLSLALVERAGAHATLERTDPPSEGLLSVPPERLDLWFTEAVATSAGSPAIRVLDEQGNEVPVTNARVDPEDPFHVIADLGTALPGTLTVVWSVRSETDGHTLNGTYSFRVGSDRAPSAATVEGTTPRAWEVATRWLTFIGTSLAAAGFLFALALIRAGDEPASVTRRRYGLAVAGAAVALLATVLEPWLQTRWPPEGTAAPSLSAAVTALPDAWWMRPAALTPALLLGLLIWRQPRRWSRLAGLGGALALAALLGLSLTSHSAAERGDWRLLAIGANILHQWTIALWVGGLAHLALWWSGHRRAAATGEVPEGADRPVRRFSRIALVLVAIGVATGVTNAGLLLPTLRSLWTSDYGVVLLVKIGILTIPLALATFHRRTIRRALVNIWPAMHRTLRLEAALVLAVVLGGSGLALLSPPSGTATTPVTGNVPKPALDAIDGEDLLVHLLFSPGTSGENRVGIRLSTYDYSDYTGVQPARVRLRFVSLDQEIVGGPHELQPAPDGTWTAPDDTQFPFDGWWRIEATLRWLGQEDVIVPFYLLLPDPNLNGFDAPQQRASDPAAAALFDQAMGVYTSWHRVRFTQTMSSQTGVVAFAQQVVNDGADGSTPGYSYIALGGVEAVVLGTTGWLRRPGEAWRTIEVNPMIPPSEWDNEYIGATGFQLGRIDDVNGEPAQIITFVVPGNGKQVTAWYVWWLGLESGQMLRDVMVSNGHYMTTDFSGFDEPAPLASPVVVSATPVP